MRHESDTATTANVGDNTFHLAMLAITYLMVALLLNDQIVTDDVVRLLPTMSLPAWLPQGSTVAMVLSVFGVCRFVIAAFVCAWVLQFVGLLGTVELPFARALDATLWAGWAIVAMSLARWLNLRAIGEARSALDIALNPLSLAWLRGVTGQALSPLDALLNLLNPFEMTWIALVAWRVRPLQTSRTRAGAIAIGAWMGCTLPGWALSSAIPWLARSR